MQPENSVVFKVFFEDEVRRFTTDKTTASSFEYLKTKLQNIFLNLKKNHFVIKWIDEDGDKVTIADDEDLSDALMSIPGNMLKIYISVKDDQRIDKVNDDADNNDATVDDQPDTPLEEMLLTKPTHLWAEFCKISAHPEEACDNCKNQIIGFRYRCVICDDFDLCGTCEGNFVHPYHVFMRFPWPMGRAAYRATKKVGRMFQNMKKDKTYDDDTNGCCKASQKDRVNSYDAKNQLYGTRHCAQAGKFGRYGHFFGNRDGRSGGHHGGHHGPHHGHHGDKFRNGAGRESWFQTFHQFVNDATNNDGLVNSGCVRRTKESVAKVSAGRSNPLAAYAEVLTAPIKNQSAINEMNCKNIQSYRSCALTPKTDSPAREDWTILNSEDHIEDLAAAQINKPIGFDMEKLKLNFQRHVGLDVTPVESSGINQINSTLPPTCPLPETQPNLLPRN